MYIEPCCIDRQLPSVLRSRTATFFSWGNWNLERLIHVCVAAFSGSKRLTVATASVDVYFCRYIRLLFQKGILTGFDLITSENEKETVFEVLAEYTDRVRYAVEPKSLVRVVALKTDQEQLVIQGDCPLNNDYLQHLFSSSTLKEIYDTITPVLEATLKIKRQYSDE